MDIKNFDISNNRKMKDINRKRRGTEFEDMISAMFERAGFHTLTRNHYDSGEADVVATIDNFRILIQTKDYSDTNVTEKYLRELIDREKIIGKEINADRILFVIRGHKNHKNSLHNLAKDKGVYLWDGKEYERLQNLDNTDLTREIKSQFEFDDEELVKNEKKEINEIFEAINSISAPRNVSEKWINKIKENKYSPKSDRFLNINAIKKDIRDFEEEQTKKEIEKAKLDENEEKELSILTERLNDDLIGLEDYVILLNKISSNLKLNNKNERILKIKEIDKEIDKKLMISEQIEENEEMLDFINDSDLSDSKKEELKHKFDKYFEISPFKKHEDTRLNFINKIKNEIKTLEFQKLLKKIGFGSIILILTYFSLWRFS